MQRDIAAPEQIKAHHMPAQQTHEDTTTRCTRVWRHRTMTLSVGRMPFTCFS